MRVILAYPYAGRMPGDVLTLPRDVAQRLIRDGEARRASHLPAVPTPLPDPPSEEPDDPPDDAPDEVELAAAPAVKETRRSSGRTRKELR